MRWLICYNVNINVNNKPKSEVVLVLRFNLLLRFHEAGEDRQTYAEISVRVRDIFQEPGPSVT